MLAKVTLKLRREVESTEGFKHADQLCFVKKIDSLTLPKNMSVPLLKRNMKQIRRNLRRFYLYVFVQDEQVYAAGGSKHCRQ